MAEISGLVLPFFGLIFLGYLTARLAANPAGEGAGDAMGWLNTFIIYLALPALFFKLVSKTPIEQLTRFDFVFASICATYTVFALVFGAGYLIRRNSLAESTVQGLAGAYGNIGYIWGRVWRCWRSANQRPCRWR